MNGFLRAAWPWAAACALCAPSAAQTTMRVSVATDGTQGNNSSLGSTISADGRVAAFYSLATNLVPSDTNASDDVFVHDLSAGVTERASVSSAGVQGNGASRGPSLSADGRFVAFFSFASNLVAPDANGGSSDVFVRDRVAGVTELISLSSAGVQGNLGSGNPSISGDGRFVAFQSIASNLVATDTNGWSDIFVRDRLTGVTERVSVATGGGQANGNSDWPRISSDGRFVSFSSVATNLVPGDTNARRDIFVHDRASGITERVSIASDGSQGDGDCFFQAPLSSDGRFVAFKSLSTNLVPGDTNGHEDIFVRDRQTGTTTRVSVSTSGTQSNNWCSDPAISGDGRRIVFTSPATNLIVGDTNGREDIFLHDRATGETERVSLSSGGSQSNNNSDSAGVSADGRFVSFRSAATNLVPGDTNAAPDIFVRDRGLIAPPHCDGDANGDGTVDFADITEVLLHWGMDYSPGTGPGDASGDGPVDFTDITAVLLNWGASC